MRPLSGLNCAMVQAGGYPAQATQEPHPMTVRRPGYWC
jgi:hypothetical protein